MKNHIYLNGCDPEGVISFENSGIHKSYNVSNACDRSVEVLGQAFAKHLSSLQINIPPEFNSGINSSSYRYFFSKGIPCEKLDPNSPGWKKGRIKLTLQFDFIPDESEKSDDSCSTEESLESELDEFR